MEIIFGEKKNTSVSRALSLLFATIDAIKLNLTQILICKNCRDYRKYYILIPVIFKRLKIYR